MIRRATTAIVCTAVLAGCPSIGVGSAIGDAQRALVHAAPAGNPLAADRARFDWFQAKAFLAEAQVRQSHGDWEQAERFARRCQQAARSAEQHLGRLDTP